MFLAISTSNTCAHISAQPRCNDAEKVLISVNMELDLYMSEEELHNALQNARNDLKKQLMKPVHGDSCIRYVVEVLEDPKVQEAFVHHLKNEDFQTFSCRPLELEILVEFIFRCKPPKICIVAPAFAAHYNIITQTVTGIEDPYIPH